MMTLDNELIAEYATTRSEEAFMAIYQRHAPMVLRACLRKHGNRADAEDATQSVFLTLSQKPAGVRSSLAGWLHETARHIVNDMALAQKRKQKREEGVALMETADDRQKLEDVKRELDEAISLLPPLIQEAIILCHLESWTVKEAAEIAGCNVRTIHRRCEEGVERLRQILTQRTGKALTASALLILLAHEAAADGPTMPLGKLQLAALLKLEPTTRVAVIASKVLKSLAWSRFKIYASIASVCLGLVGSAGLFGLVALRSTPQNNVPLASSKPLPAARKPQPVSTLLRGHTAAIRQILYSEDGKILASCDAEGTIILWDVAAKTRRITFTGHRTAITYMGVFPNCNRFVSQSADGVVKLWNVLTGKELLSCSAPNVETSWSITSDGATLTIIGTDGTTRQWDMLSGKEKARLPAKGATARTTQAFAELLVTGNDDGTVRIFNQATGKEKSFQAHPTPVNLIDFRPDGKQFLTTAGDNTIKLWNASTGKLQFTLPHASNAVSSVIFAADSRILYASSDDGVITAWDTSTGKRTKTFSLPKASLWGWSHDRKTIAVVESGKIKLWDPRTGDQKRELVGHCGKISTLTFSPDNGTIATGSENGTLELWKLAASKK